MKITIDFDSEEEKELASGVTRTAVIGPFVFTVANLIDVRRILSVLLLWGKKQ